jgi:TM2 domain-containing membrane protein YozV
MEPTTMGPASDAHRTMLYDANKKSMGLAYVLWFFLGTFGGHRFYAGKTGTAVALLCITLASFLLMFVFVGFLTIWISAVWALVDAFLIPAWIREHNNRLIASLTK